eukprot:359425-Chlamydomonas_euryale.AAC.4
MHVALFAQKHTHGKLLIQGEGKGWQGRWQQQVQAVRVGTSACKQQGVEQACSSIPPPRRGTSSSNDRLRLAYCSRRRPPGPRGERPAHGAAAQHEQGAVQLGGARILDHGVPGRHRRRHPRIPLQLGHHRAQQRTCAVSLQYTRNTPAVRHRYADLTFHDSHATPRPPSPMFALNPNPKS